MNCNNPHVTAYSVRVRSKLISWELRYDFQHQCLFNTPSSQPGSDAPHHHKPCAGYVPSNRVPSSTPSTANTEIHIMQRGMGHLLASSVRVRSKLTCCLRRPYFPTTITSIPHTSANFYKNNPNQKQTTSLPQTFCMSCAGCVPSRRVTSSTPSAPNSCCRAPRSHAMSTWYWKLGPTAKK